MEHVETRSRSRCRNQIASGTTRFESQGCDITWPARCSLKPKLPPLTAEWNSFRFMNEFHLFCERRNRNGNISNEAGWFFDPYSRPTDKL